jgi:restriction system protein
MYWLLDYEEQENLRQRIIRLQEEIIQPQKKEHSEQVFPFIGRKSRAIANIIISNLTKENDLISDPFGGSGTFAYAALDCNRRILINEWEPYAFRMMSAPFRGVPNLNDLSAALEKFSGISKPTLDRLYRTRCPKCGNELTFDGLFFDRAPEKYFNPTWHERMGPSNENVIFRDKFQCECGCKEKNYDAFDETIRQEIEKIDENFPDAHMIENSRLNFTAPQFTIYRNLFSKRQRVALVTINNAIQQLPNAVRPFFEDTFLSIIHLGKYTDYRSKSQDNHCPENRLKETNLYNRFLEKLIERKEYITSQHFDLPKVTVQCSDFRDSIGQLNDASISLVLTDPPYGDNAQYFEHAQRVHPFMGYCLANDEDRLKKEVVISNAKDRTDKHDKEQFLRDIEVLITEASRVLIKHGSLVLYFRPEQSDWISDLNKLKHLGRKHGLEPLISIPIDNSAPSMRALASAAWTFKKDVCFVFLKLADHEMRWYEGDTDIDELIYLAASSAATDQGNPFVIARFNQELQCQLRKNNLMMLLNPKYSQKIQQTLERFATKDNAQYRLTGLSPYEFINKDMNAEIRLREFIPVVIEELTADGKGFTFEEYVIRLASFMENGSREIIAKLHTSNKLIPELLAVYAEENKEQGKFFAKTATRAEPESGKIHLRNMDPSEFEKLIADYFVKRGFIKTQVIGKSCDRGVDVLATNLNGELELIQCKRYRAGNNIGSTPIQRVDSYMRSRHAKKAWVITTSDFTAEGRDEARISNVTVMNGEDLIRSLELYYPGKYQL